jgi:hypothetical protein
MARMSVQEAQEICAQVAGTLLGIEDLLRHVLEMLPESPDRGAMEEGEAPCDVATDMRGALECVIADDLQPAVRTLEDAASATDARLAREWRENQKRRIRLH